MAKDKPINPRSFLAQLPDSDDEVEHIPTAKEFLALKKGLEADISSEIRKQQRGDSVPTILTVWRLQEFVTACKSSLDPVVQKRLEKHSLTLSEPQQKELQEWIEEKIITSFEDKNTIGLNNPETEQKIKGHAINAKEQTRQLFEQPQVQLRNHLKEKQLLPAANQQITESMKQEIIDASRTFILDRLALGERQFTLAFLKEQLAQLQSQASTPRAPPKAPRALTEVKGMVEAEEHDLVVHLIKAARDFTHFYKELQPVVRSFHASAQIEMDRVLIGDAHEEKRLQANIERIAGRCITNTRIQDPTREKSHNKKEIGAIAREYIEKTIAKYKAENPPSASLDSQLYRIKNELQFELNDAITKHATKELMDECLPFISKYIESQDEDFHNQPIQAKVEEIWKAFLKEHPAVAETAVTNACKQRLPDFAETIRERVQKAANPELDKGPAKKKMKR